AARPAVFDIADDIVALVDLRQDLAPAQKPAAGEEIETEPAFQTAEGIRLAATVGDQPDFGHAAAVEEFLKIKSSHPLLSHGLGRFCFPEFARHYLFLNTLRTMARTKLSSPRPSRRNLIAFGDQKTIVAHAAAPGA